MGEYYSYPEIVNFMRRIANALGEKAQLVSIGKTHENRDLFGIQVRVHYFTFNVFQFGKPRDTSRKVTWIDSGIHAREWTAVHTGIYMVYVVSIALTGGCGVRWLKGDFVDKVPRSPHKVL